MSRDRRSTSRATRRRGCSSPIRARGSPSSAKSRTGRWYSRASRDAAMPRTPRCQPGAPRIRRVPLGIARLARYSSRASARHAPLDRLPLGVARGELRGDLRARARASRSSKRESASSAVSSRPAAFSRGRDSKGDLLGRGRRPRRTPHSREQRAQARGARAGERARARARRSSGSPAQRNEVRDRPERGDAQERLDEKAERPRAARPPARASCAMPHAASSFSG